MRKRARALAVVCLFALAAPGCGKKSEPTTNPNEVREFHTVVQDGAADAAERLLRIRPYLANAKNENGETPLQVAKQRGDEEMVDLLRKHGAKE
jgi:ankyrin repeat protein